MKTDFTEMKSPEESAAWLMKKLDEDQGLSDVVHKMREMALKNLMIHPASERGSMMWGLITAAMSVGYEVAMQEVNQANRVFANLQEAKDWILDNCYNDEGVLMKNRLNDAIGIALRSPGIPENQRAILYGNFRYRPDKDKRSQS